jgi:N-methylhydantoinase A
VRVPLDEAAVRALVPELRAQNVESVAFAFLHSYANPEHERRARGDPATAAVNVRR